MTSQPAPKNLLVSCTVVAILAASMLQSTTIISHISVGNTISHRISTAEQGLNSTMILPDKQKEESPFLLPKNNFQPVTQLIINRKEDCTPDPHQPLHKVPGLFENYINISKQVYSSALKPLVCQFQTDQPYSKHFAHAMQQLYGCYSFYQEHSGITRILVLSEKLKSHFDTNAFLKGYLQFLVEQMKVVIQSPHSIDEQYEDYLSATPTYIPGGYFISHVKELHQLMRQFLSNSSDSSPPRNNPRIGILNRRPSVGRSIQNTKTLVDAISNSTMSFPPQISVEFFEGRSFAEQIRFFQNTDILLSPHGAQLTGLPFLAECGQLLEIFPNNYFIPAFYGSLARNADLGYSYLYLSNQTKPNESRTSLEHRVQARAQNLCLSPSIVQQAIDSLVQDWRDCRHRHIQEMRENEKRILTELSIVKT